MTIPIDPRFIPAFSIEDVILDKDTGAPLAGGLVYFEQDNQRGILKPIYQITGTSPDYTFTQLPNPMTLSAIGTFVDALDNPVIPYFYPYDANGGVELYYIRVTDYMDVPQFDREAQPYLAAQGTDEILSVITNEISNPQFIEVFFDTSVASVTHTVNAVTNSVINIAPDWDLIVSAPGAGSVTLSQTRPIGTLNLLTNPGTVLTISSAGLTKLQLRQRIYGSPNLWGSGYLSASFVAKTYSGTGVTLNMYYSQSNGSVVDQVLVAASLPASGAYEQFPRSVLIPASNSTQSYPDAYIDIYFDIPLSIKIDITSVMLAFTGATSIENIDYDQESEARQVDHLFHYYKPQLEFKPIPSYLTGWDFPLNPAQLLGSTVAATSNANAYVWDQTILFQSTVSRINTTRAADGSIVLTATGGAVQAALIQYLPQTSARSLLRNALASNIFGSTTESGGLNGTVSLWYTTNVSVPVLPLSLVTTLDANGHPSAVVAGWTEVTRPNKIGNALFALTADLENTGMTGWDVSDTSIPETATYFAIVVGTESITDGSSATFKSISLVPGDIATIPAPQTPDQVLRECEYYYEKSYDPSVVVGAVTGIGALSATMLPSRNGGNTDNTLVARQFSIRFREPKRITPNTNTSVTLYTNLGGGVDDLVLGILFSGGTQIFSGNIAVAGNWQGNSGTTGVVYQPANVNNLLSFTTGATTTAEAFIEFHYVVDVRLGII